MPRLPGLINGWYSGKISKSKYCSTAIFDDYDKQPMGIKEQSLSLRSISDIVNNPDIGLWLLLNWVLLCVLLCVCFYSLARGIGEGQNL